MSQFVIRGNVLGQKYLIEKNHRFKSTMKQILSRTGTNEGILKLCLLVYKIVMTTNLNHTDVRFEISQNFKYRFEILHYRQN